MANFRQIHTQIWKDGWFSDLDPDEKLLFIYLFSNESTSLSGIYRITKKFISFETGINKTRVDEILDKFKDNGKVFYEGDIVWIINMRKFHATKSSRVQTRITNDIGMIPDSEIKRSYIAYQQSNIPYRYPMDSLQQLKEDEDEKEDEDKKSSPSDSFDIVHRSIEMITGLSQGGKPAVDSINAIVEMGALFEDIQAGYAWLCEKKKDVKFYSQLIGPTRTAMSKRLQLINGKQVTERAYSEVHE